MNSTAFHRQILELIRRTSAYLPPDVNEVIEAHRALEAFDGRERWLRELADLIVRRSA